MAIIDAEGLFNGDRFDDVSDVARLHWPYLWCASNTLGRLELNYHKILGRVYGRFHTKPTEDELMAWIHEYMNAYLLFVYESDGALWGQWDTTAKFLPTYQTTADKQTPSPDATQITEWREQYVEKKRLKRANSWPINNSKNFLKNSKTFSTSPNGIGIGIGIGIGEGIGKDSCSARAERETVSPESPTQPKSADEPTPLAFAVQSKTGLQVIQPDALDGWFETEFWPLYPRKTAKAAAKKAARRKATSPEVRERILAGLRAHLPSLQSRDTQYIPHAATWLNGERWSEDPEVPGQALVKTGQSGPQGSSLTFGMQRHFNTLAIYEQLEKGGSF